MGGLTTAGTGPDIGGKLAGGGPANGVPCGGVANGDGTPGPAKGLTGGLTIVSATGAAVSAAAVATEYAGKTDSWTATGIQLWPFQTHFPSGDIIGGSAGGLDPCVLTLPPI